jgi:hypothetical protein
MWHFDKDKKEKMKFGELVSMKGKQNVQIKENPQEHTEISKLPKTIDFNMNLNKTVIQSLQLKLAYLSSLLNTESDVTKTKETLECIRICMENIQTAKSNNL